MRINVSPILIRPGFRISVGPGPYSNADSREVREEQRGWLNDTFTAIVNVSDETFTATDPLPRVPTFWVPLIEVSPWGFASLFALKRILDGLLFSSSESNPSHIYLHCHGGTNRSRAIAQIWLKSLLRTSGGTLDSVPQIPDARWAIDKNLIEGCLPPHFAEFLAAMNRYPTMSAVGVLNLVNLLDEALTPQVAATQAPSAQ